MNKYIKVTLKDKDSIVVLASNAAFYTKRGAKIETPTAEEIKEFFPGDTSAFKSVEPATNALSALTTANEKLKEAEEKYADTQKLLDDEIAAHGTSKQQLTTANEKLKEAEEQIKKLSKK